MKNQSVAEKNVTAKTKPHGFDEFIYLIDLSNFTDYKIPIYLSRLLCALLSLFFDNLSRNSYMRKGSRIMMLFPSLTTFVFTWHQYELAC